LKKLEAKIEASGVPQEVIATIANEIAVIKAKITALLASL
jgi:hypothetical protein